MPRVSVVIPSYNCAAYLPEAVQSVLGQTFRDFEILVVDDGSTDETPELAAAFGRAVRYIRQANRGLSAARNTGIDRSTGQYISVLDADDLVEPDYLELMLAALDAAPDAAAVYCGYRTVDPANRPLFQVKRPPALPPERLHAALLDGNFIAPPCILVRRDAYAQAGPFDERLTACEDWDMWLRIAALAPVLPLDRLLVRYRVRPGSMSGDPERMLRNRLRVLDKHARPAGADGPSQSRTAYGHAYLAAAVDLLQARQAERALDCLLQAATWQPALLGELGTHYELVFWDQPRGWRGDFQRVDPVAAERLLMELLERLFDAPDLPPAAGMLRSSAMAMAYRALGLVCYGRRELGAARGYFVRSLAKAPRQALDSDFLLALARTCLGPRFRPRRRPTVSSFDAHPLR